MQRRRTVLVYSATLAIVALFLTSVSFSTAFAEYRAVGAYSYQLQSTVFHWSGMTWSRAISGNPVHESISVGVGDLHQLFVSASSRTYGNWIYFGVASERAFNFATSRTFYVNMSTQDHVNRLKIELFLAPKHVTNSPINIAESNYLLVQLNGDYIYGKWYAEVMENVNNSNKCFCNFLYNNPYSSQLPAHWKIVLDGANNVKIYLNNALIYSSSQLDLQFTSGYLYFDLETPVSHVFTITSSGIQVT